MRSNGQRGSDEDLIFASLIKSAIGAAVDVQHCAATPVGHHACATAEVINLEGQRVEFKVPASDGIEEIGSGT
ncbi:thioesterase, FlK family [Bradyrhizobium hereditatis]|uniref:thioesterase, FlK family n=1 Tax=Bradyrhizobium hereditatis TaxID=2821405 RepID=UPI0035DEC0A7